MKLSEFNTNEAADVLCEITPLLDNICTDETLIDSFGKALDTAEMTKTGLYMEFCHRLSKITPVLLKTHRADVFGVLAVLNRTSPEEIGKQPVMETMAQIKGVLMDKDLLSFFGSFSPLGRNA